MEDFPNFIDPLEALKLEREFQEMDLKNEDDDYLKWRIRVNQALAEEGVNIRWYDEHEYATIQALTHKGDVAPKVNVPYLHLEDLFNQEAHPSGVAAYLKAVTFDPRFRLWNQEEEDEGPLV